MLCTYPFGIKTLFQQLFEPIAAQHTEAVLTVQQNQAELSQTLDALKKKLEESLQYSQLPQVGSYLQKLAEIKKRVAVMTSKLNMTSERLVRTHRFAETQHGVLRSHNDTQQVRTPPPHTHTSTPQQWATPFRRYPL